MRRDLFPKERDSAATETKKLLKDASINGPKFLRKKIPGAGFNKTQAFGSPRSSQIKVVSDVISQESTHQAQNFQSSP